MIKIWMLTTESGPFSEFVAVLEKEDDVELHWASSGHEALETLSGHPVDLVVVNETIGDMTGIEFIKKLLPINPMINSALVSPLPPKEFHEATEGLGVLVQLSTRPGQSEAENVLNRLRKLTHLTNCTHIGKGKKEHSL